MKHTPGPWSVDSRATLRVKDSIDQTICSTGTSASTREEWEANAKLIAKAPELLELLKLYAYGSGDTARAHKLIKELE